MRIVFMGTAEFACPALSALVRGGDDAEVVAVLSQPDRPSGRGLGVAPSHVKTCALSLGIPVHTPEKINTPESLALLKGLAPDLIVVVAYGQILKAPILSLPSLGCLNIHGSLLPKYRGAAPIQWAVANGEAVTGVTAMIMNARMDAGDMILQREVAIGPEETAGQLHDRLAKAGAEALLAAVRGIRDGTAPRRPQIESEATLAPKLSREDGHIQWTRAAREICNRVRGFNPWPGSYCRPPSGDILVKVRRARLEAGRGAPGEVLDVLGEGPLVAAGTDAVRLLEVQPEGKKPMPGKAFLCGHELRVGEVLK